MMFESKKYGYLKPRVQIEPITIKGATIEYVTGHNAEFIRKNKIGIGGKIVRSGDVIPKIQDVIVKAEHAKMPDVQWKWNETKVDAIIKDMNNNKIMIEKNWNHLLANLKYNSIGNIRKLYQLGLIYTKTIKITVDDLIKIPGFQTKSASKIVDSLNEQLSKMPITINHI